MPDLSANRLIAWQYVGQVWYAIPYRYDIRSHTDVIYDPIHAYYMWPHPHKADISGGGVGGYLDHTHIQICWDLLNSPDIGVRWSTQLVDMCLQPAGKSCTNFYGFQYCWNDAFPKNMALSSCPLVSTTTISVLMLICCREFQAFHVIASVMHHSRLSNTLKTSNNWLSSAYVWKPLLHDGTWYPQW